MLSAATPVQAKLYPLHLSFHFISLKQLSEEYQDQVWWNTKKALWSEGLCCRKEAGWLGSKATEKRSTFSPTGGVCQAVTAQWGSTPCTTSNSTHFQVLGVNNKQPWILEVNEISFPDCGIFFFFRSLEGYIIYFGLRFGRCIYECNLFFSSYFAPFLVSGLTGSSTICSSKD